MHIYDTDISITFGEFAPIIDWCKNNCEHQWQVQVLNESGDHPGNYKFFFESETDYINFIVWQK